MATNRERPVVARLRYVLMKLCLFTNKIYSISDEYFVSNIEKVDSVTLLRKDKVMNGVSWSMRFQQALSTWPCLNDLGASAVQVKKRTKSCMVKTEEFHNVLGKTQ